MNTEALTLLGWLVLTGALFTAWITTRDRLKWFQGELGNASKRHYDELCSWKRAVSQVEGRARRAELLTAQERERNDQLVSLVATMRQQGFSGGHMEQFEEPETYALDDAEELAEHQRRIALLEEVVEEGDTELANGLMQSRTNNPNEYEELEQYEEY